MNLLSSQHFSAQDIKTAPLLVATLPTDVDVDLLVQCDLSGLNSGHATRELRVTLDGVPVGPLGTTQNAVPVNQSDRFFPETLSATVTRLQRHIGPVAATQTVKVYLFSSNASDNSVTGSVNFWNMSVDEALSVIDGNVDAIKAKTDNLPANPASQTKLDTLHDTRIPGVVQPQTGDSFARLGAPAGASISADIAAVKSDTAGIKSKTDALPANPASQTKLDTLHDTRLPGVVQPQTGDSFARLGAPAGASVSADLAAVKSDTANILTTGGAGPWGGGGSGLSGTLSIALSLTADDLPVPNALVAVRDDSDAITLAVFQADANGVVNLDPESGTPYKLRITRPGVAIWANPVARTWNANGSDTIDGTLISITPPASPELCTAFVFTQAAPGATDFYAELVSAPDAYAGVLLDKTKTAFAIVGDHLELQLVRTAEYLIASDRYGVRRKLTVPDAATCDVAATLGIT